MLVTKLLNTYHRGFTTYWFPNISLSIGLKTAYDKNERT